MIQNLDLDHDLFWHVKRIVTFSTPLDIKWVSAWLKYQSDE